MLVLVGSDIADPIEGAINTRAVLTAAMTTQDAAPAQALPSRLRRWFPSLEAGPVMGSSSCYAARPNGAPGSHAGSPPPSIDP